MEDLLTQTARKRCAEIGLNEPEFPDWDMIKLLFIFWNHTTDDVLHAMTWQMAMPRRGRGNCRGEMFGARPRTKEENYFGETAENQNSFEGL